MTKKKPALKVKSSVTSGSCFIYSDYGSLVCPLCGVTVPKSTAHRCELPRGTSQTSVSDTKVSDHG